MSAIERNREKRNFIRAAIAGIKQELGCSRCGYNEHPQALQFDHRNPDEKSFNISKDMLRNWDSLVDEMCKCDVLCANCHAVKTYESKDHITT